MEQTEYYQDHTRDLWENIIFFSTVFLIVYLNYHSSLFDYIKTLNISFIGMDFFYNVITKHIYYFNTLVSSLIIYDFIFNKIFRTNKPFTYINKYKYFILILFLSVIFYNAISFSILSLMLIKLVYDIKHNK